MTDSRLTQGLAMVSTDLWSGTQTRQKNGARIQEKRRLRQIQRLTDFAIEDAAGAQSASVPPGSSSTLCAPPQARFVGMSSKMPTTSRSRLAHVASTFTMGKFTLRWSLLV